MQDLLTANGAMDFVRQYNKNTYNVPCGTIKDEMLKEANEAEQQRVDELLENNADDERYEAFELDMTERGIDTDYWCDYQVN